MQLLINFIKKIIITIFFYKFQVWIILNNFFTNISKVGALTSKPFAYKAWSWELTSSYVVDLSNHFNNKIRVDLKGLEIVWILPWLANSFSENWISDKSRFFYDGLSLNRVTKFFFRKKTFIQFFISFLLIFVDPIFQKYIYTHNLFDNLILLSKFKNSKENFYDFFYALFTINNFFFTYFSCYTLPLASTKILVNSCFFLDKKIYFKFFFSRNEFFMSLLNKFFYQRKIKFFKKNFWFYLNQLKKIDYLGIKKIPGLFFSKIFYFKLKNNLNLSLNFNLDVLTASMLKFLSFQKKITLFGLNLNLIKTFLIKNKFNFFNLNILQNNNIIVLINTNLRVINPSLHLYLRRLVLANNLLIINFGNNNLNFKHLNFGSKINVLYTFLRGSCWLSSLYVKKHFISFFINFDTAGLITSPLHNFFFLKNFLYFTNTNIWKKLYLNIWPNFFFVSNYNFINIISDLNFFLKKKSVKSLYSYRTFYKNYSKVFLYSNITSTEGNFIYANILSKDFFNLKKSFYFLFETNIINWKLDEFWDFIFPVSTITENFLLIKNYFARMTKSLFLKFGPWFSWSFFNYLKFIFLFSTYPFLWNATLVLRCLNITFLFLNFWLQGCFYIDFLAKSFINNKKKIKNLFLVNEFFFISKKIKSLISFKSFHVISLNSWFSNISFIKSSKYVSLGLNLLKKEKKTIF